MKAEMETGSNCMLEEIIWKASWRVDLRGVRPEAGESLDDPGHK